MQFCVWMEGIGPLHTTGRILYHVTKYIATTDYGDRDWDNVFALGMVRDIPSPVEGYNILQGSLEQHKGLLDFFCRMYN